MQEKKKELDKKSKEKKETKKRKTKNNNNYDHYDFQLTEKKWQDYWQKEDIYTFNFNSDKKIFSIDTPPPTVSGKMHLGHAFSYSHFDFIARFKRMSGFNVFYPWGFDDDGLPTEKFIEKKFNIKAKGMKRSDFVNLCLKETKKVEETLKEKWRKIGLSIDFSLNYRTIDKNSIKISQKSFLDLYKAGREYRKESPTLWCPKCETAIAQVELEDKEIDSKFIYILFNIEGKDVQIATTRPELLPSCVAVLYNPSDKRYKKFKDKKAKVPLFNFEVPVIEDRRVDKEKGTGLVMCCTFGDQTDIEWWKAYNLPLKISFTKDGKMNELAGKYQGLSIKDARKKIIDDLNENGLLIKTENIKHMVNVHERCGTEIEFFITKQWFIRYLDLKEKFLGLGKRVRWHPQYMFNRYKNWVNGLQWDWCISRQRYFGVPFPVWYCKKCGRVILADEKQLPVDPTQDKPPIKKCSCGSEEFIPEKDVLDTWATSSLTPDIALSLLNSSSSLRRPKTSSLKKSKAKPKIPKIPFSLRPQAHDIITFWAFNTIVKSWFHHKDIPWKDIMISGWALDSHGKKMSKSKGNVIDPSQLLEKYGADALRFWAASSKLGSDLWFSEREFIAGKKTVTKLWNASKFVFSDLKKKPKKIITQVFDKWLILKLNKLIKECTDNFEEYEYSKVKSAIENFFWHTFCDNYLEITKKRLYKPKTKQEKQSAQSTLYISLLAIIKIFAPIIPHITEEIYQRYFIKYEKDKSNKSIHTSKWPKYIKLKDKLNNLSNIEKQGDYSIEIISKVRQIKARAHKSLKAEIILTLEKKTQKEIKDFIPDIKAVTNAKEIKEGKFNVEFL